FGTTLKNPPSIFSVNYFLRDDKGNFLNDKSDKAVWLKWMELRSHKDVGAIKISTGLIPKYQDLKGLFMEVLGKDYSKEDYVKQFTLRVPENLSRINRITKIYKTKALDTPKILFKVVEEQRERLKKAREKYGDYIPPDKFQES
ncbi:MAG: phosphoenolpyruvate carboxykinase domain-containing protein, partial [Candidatus Aerophobetes bacterium]|nr:phosphoenolpyruvate carboxykinase domain-containing protein [Candidatus Aerophobetes bacterium]